MRVLIVEDDAQLRQIVVERLRQEGFAVDEADNGQDGWFIAAEYPIDMAIVDLGLPQMSGLELIQKLRKEGKSVPILILTARDRWQDKVEGLDAGADDYLTKPFHLEEMMARLRVLMRRSSGFDSSRIECGPVAMDTSTQRVYVAEREVDLTAYEYKVLEYLMLNTGKVISKSRLSEHIYEEDDDRDSNVIEVFIRRLRSKLDPDESLQPIETLRGRGYRFNLKRA